MCTVNKMLPLFFTVIIMLAFPQDCVSLKLSDHLPGCSGGKISYIVRTDMNPNFKFSVFQITEGTTADECALLCHIHYFCRSVGFEPNDHVSAGGLCYLSYKKYSLCTKSEMNSQSVTDYQALNPVWLMCDQCIDNGMKLEKTLQRLPNDKKQNNLLSPAIITDQSEMNNLDGYYNSD